MDFAIRYLTMKVNIAQRINEESTKAKHISNLWKVSLKSGLLRSTMMAKVPGNKCNQTWSDQGCIKFTDYKESGEE